MKPNKKCVKISRKPESKGQRDKDGKHQDLQFKISTSSSESSEITIAGSAGIFLCCLLKRLRKYFSAALVIDFSNMFFIHSFHMFGMRSCVPNSLRMLVVNKNIRDIFVNWGCHPPGQFIMWERFQMISDVVSPWPFASLADSQR